MTVIEIPDLEDEEEELQLPNLSHGGFGSTSTPSLTDSDTTGYSHRYQSSQDTLPKFGGPSTTPTRPIPTKASSGPSNGFGQDIPEHRRLGKFSNGSSSSIITPATSIGSTPGFLAARKGSLASLKNAFKSSSTNLVSASPVPPVPILDNSGYSGYPALKNPFSKYDSPAFQAPSSPSSTGYYQSPRTNRNGSFASPGTRRPSNPNTTTHTNNKSIGGRSIASQGSSFKGDEGSVPALPPIPMRTTPSRLGRQGSESGASLMYGLPGKRQGSLGGYESIEGKTPGEEALRVVFKEFKAIADAKIARICGRPLNTQPSLGAYLESGSDAQLDTITLSIAHCSRRHPRRVLELLQNWCKGHCEGISASDVRAHLDRSLGLNMRIEDAAAILGGRKSSAAKYLLNRTLIELVRVSPKEVLGEEIGMQLEANAFGSYRNEKGEENVQLPHRKALAALRIDLLGELSKSRFLTMSHRFITELSKHASQAPSKENDAKMEHLLKGMQHLTLKVYPEHELEMSSEFIQALATLYSTASSQPLRNAYAETLTALLHPTIESATAEVNHPMWSKAIAIILQRALAGASKPKTWGVSFPLVVVALGVSPREVFMQQWQNLIGDITSKLKDRSSRVIALNGFIRILWIYLNRCSESLTSTRKRLDALTKIFFAPSEALFPNDIQTETFTWILHIIMTRQVDYGEEFVKDFLPTLERTPTDPALLARASCLVTAISATLKAVEEDRSATWPASSDFERLPDSPPDTTGDILPEETASKPEIPELLARAFPSFFDLLATCDRIGGSTLLSSDTVTISGTASSNLIDNADTVTRKHGDVNISYSARYEPVFRLQAAILDSYPRLLGNDTNFSQLSNILCRATLSADPRVSEAASNAMRRISEDPKRCLFLSNSLREFVFETRHVFKDTFIGARLLESQFERIGQLWLDLLQQSVKHQRIAAAQHEDEEITLSGSIMGRIEGCALVLLASTSLALRRLAGQVLFAVRDLEGSQRRPSAAFRYSRMSPEKSALTRVSQLYETILDDSEIGTIKKIPSLSSADRQKFEAVVREGNLNIQKIAESDQAKDTSLWLAILPYFISRISSLLPGPATEVRNVIVNIAIRLQVHVAGIANVNSARTAATMKGVKNLHRSSSDIVNLADHWKAYLSIICVTMPVSQHPPTTPPIPRTKDAIILTPDTIGTPVLFHYLTSLLAWEDPRFRDSAAYAMGAVEQTHFRPLSEVLLGVARRLADARKTSGQNALWTAVAHVFRLISPLILDVRSSSHLTNLSSMISFVKISFNMLSDPSSRDDHELQSFRRSFCIVVENLANSLGKLDSSDRFFGEDIRGAIFKLCYDWCLIGRRPDVAKARESHFLQAAADSYRGERDRAQYLDDLQTKTKLLSAAAAEALTALCQGKLVSSVDPSPTVEASVSVVDPLVVLRWTRGMFSSASQNHHDTARNALQSLLKHNWQCSRLVDEVLHQSFGEGEQFSLESSFFGVMADVLLEGGLQLPLEQFGCLALSKLGHPNSDVRQKAFQLVVSLLPDNKTIMTVAALFPAVASSSQACYRTAQRDIADVVAETFPHEAMAFLAESVGRLTHLEAPRRLATLSILSSWVQHIELSLEPADVAPREAVAEQQALSDLIYLSIRFLDDHPLELQDILVNFVGLGDTGNSTALIKFLFEQGGRRKSPEFVIHAQKLLACLAASAVGNEIFIEICDFVEPAAMAFVADSESMPTSSTSLENLDAILSTSKIKSQTFSTGQLALLFAGELLPHRIPDTSLGSRLPTLLHVALIHCDSPATCVRDQAQLILFQVLRIWVHDAWGIVDNDMTSIWMSTERKLTALAQSGPSVFWKVDDPSLAFSAPGKLTNMVMKIFGILHSSQPHLRQIWGELAVTWATSCPIRHLACRSFQIFRVLSPKVNAKMISDILARLSNTIGSGSAEIQAFNLEVIRTFGSIIQNVTSLDSRSYPQIFWCAMACLTTPHENEFMEVIELLSHILDKMNLSDPSVIQQLQAHEPTEWSGSPPYLQSLLLVGLRSSRTAFVTFDLIRRLSSVSSFDLIDSHDDRLLHGFVSALPWMLHSTDLGEPNEDLGMMAMDLAAIADNQGNPSFSRLLTSFAKVKFRSKDDFIRQACSLLREQMAGAALTIITILLGFVLNDTDWMREKAMQVLTLVLQSPEARSPLTTHGAELLQPLLRLVSTKYSAQALEILDMPIVAAAQAESLTTSMMVTGDIFGSISETGWSIPKPKEMSSLTRENVTAVFNTCGSETRAASAHFSVVQFTDIARFKNESELSLDLPSPEGKGDLGMSSDNASMGDLVNALHSLGQFFGENMDEEGGRGDSRNQKIGKHANEPSDSISERKIQAIMARGRNASITSPIYESDPATWQTSKHKHTVSDAITETSSTSSRDRDDTQRFGKYAIDSDLRAPSSGRFNQHQSNPSFSSQSAASEADQGRNENLFGLDETSVGQDIYDASTASLNHSNLIDRSEQSTPVMMKPRPRFGGREGWDGWDKQRREGTATPSPTTRGVVGA